MLKGKNAIVTGAGRGIGNAIVKTLIENGANVYAIVRREGDMNASFAQWTESYGEEASARMHETVLDVGKLEDAKSVLCQINKECGGIDILVNNAGIMKDALIGMITEELMEETFRINVFAPIQLSQYAARFMKKKKSGRIINIASIVGIRGNAGQSVYSASKGAVISFTKSAAKELAPFGITVNAIAPGIIATDLLKNVPEDQLKEKIDNIKMGRVGTPEDVAKTVAYLASDAAEYVSGQVLEVDGCTIM